MMFLQYLAQQKPVSNHSLYDIVSSLIIIIIIFVSD